LYSLNKSRNSNNVTQLTVDLKFFYKEKKFWNLITKIFDKFVIRRVNPEEESEEGGRGLRSGENEKSWQLQASH
jgi:hypothetical protein